MLNARFVGLLLMLILFEASLSWGAATAASLLERVDANMGYRGIVLNKINKMLDNPSKVSAFAKNTQEFDELADGLKKRFPTELGSKIDALKKQYASPETPPSAPTSPPKPDSSPKTPEKSYEPKDVMESKEKECKIDTDAQKPDPKSDPCRNEADKKCGYDSCSFFYKSKGEKDCKQFVESKKKYEEAKAKSPSNQAEISAAKTKADADGAKCCQARKAAEGLQRLIQGTPCAGMLKGDPLTGTSLDDCKPWILSSNCPITDKAQLKQLYNDRGFMKSLGVKDLGTVKNMVMSDQGLTDFGDLKPELQSSLLKSLGGDKVGNVNVLSQGNPSDLKVTKDGFTTQSGNYPFSKMAESDLAVNTKTGEVGISNAGTSASVRSGDPIKPVSVTSNPLTVSKSGQSSFKSSSSSGQPGSLRAPDAGETIIALKDVAQNIGNLIIGRSLTAGTGQAFYEPSNVPIIISFFDYPPPPAQLFSINSGFVFDDWVEVIPRANAQIDFDGQNKGVITSVIQDMGIPMGSSLMANPANLREKSVFIYTIDGKEDYDFLLSDGLVLWADPIRTEGKIIASSFGIPPNEYLSNQQRAMVYG